MTYKDGDEAAVRFAERLILRAASEVFDKVTLFVNCLNCDS